MKQKINKILFPFSKDLEYQFKNIYYQISKINGYIDSEEFVEAVADVLLGTPFFIEILQEKIQEVILINDKFKNDLAQLIEEILVIDSDFIIKVQEVILTDKYFKKIVDEVLNSPIFKNALDEATKVKMNQLTKNNETSQDLDSNSFNIVNGK